jgi:tRNA dimethylallyltransferase
LTQDDKVPFLVGPTASGKTASALLVADNLGAQILSADSRQIYRDLTIGTAKPTPRERALIPHHFVDCLEPTASYSAGEFSRQGRAKIEELLPQEIIPFVVGGSGLYISALADDFFSGPAADPELRSRLKQRAGAEGVNILYRELQAIDPEAAAKIMATDYRRIERALEIYLLTGIPISRMRRQKANPPPYQPVMVGLDWPRRALYERINARCLQMLEEGLVEEVRRLVTQRKLTPQTCNALDSVGYKEVNQYLQGEVDYTEMVRLFQRNTRIRWVAMEPELPMYAVAERIQKIYQSEGIAKE